VTRTTASPSYAATFALLGTCWALVAVLNRGWYLLLLWPAVSFLALAAAYGGLGPRVLGKSPRGRIPPLVVAVLLPYLLLTWMTWHVARLLSRGQAGHEVAPGVYVGRRAFVRELPAGTTLIVDMTCEFPIPRAVAEGREYLCVPTLDGTAPPESALREVLARASGCAGNVYIHCAQGRGRSAAVAAAILIARGTAGDVDEAEAIMRRVRPRIRLNNAQRAWVRRVSALTDSTRC
jgi:hypothetical protein